MATSAVCRRYASATVAMVVIVLSTSVADGGADLHRGASVRRTVSGSGARRNLTTTVAVDVELPSPAAGTTTATTSADVLCSVVLLQPLPRAVFLDDLRSESSGVGPSPASVTLFAGQRVEALAELAEEQTVLLHTTATAAAATTTHAPAAAVVVATVWLTLHTRYHRAVAGGALVPPVEINHPQVFVACGASAANGLPPSCRSTPRHGDAPSLQLCTQELATTWATKGYAVGEPVYIAGITRGDTTHLPAVLFATIACTAAAFVWVARGIAHTAGGSDVGVEPPWHSQAKTKTA
jgi:hypothetical protein